MYIDVEDGCEVCERRGRAVMECIIHGYFVCEECCLICGKCWKAE